MPVTQRGGAQFWPDFWWENSRQFKSWCPHREDTILREGTVLIRMATSQAGEEMSVEEAVQPGGAH